MIHPTAIIAPKAEIEEGVEIGPYCIIGPNVKIKKGTKLLGHVFIDGYTTINENCTIFPFASIGTQTQDLKYKGGITFVEIGRGTTLREYVTVNSGTNEGDITQVGENCHIMACCHIAHQCKLGNRVIMSNAALLAGHVVIEDYAVIGGMAGVHQFVRIGKMAMLGACSKATQDIAPFMLADGNPAVTYGINAVALERNNVPQETQRALKEAFKIIFKRNLTIKEAVETIKNSLPPLPELEHLCNFVISSERGLAR